MSLYRQAPSGRRPESGSPNLGEELVLNERCVFPLIRGEGGSALRDLSPERLDEILEEDEVERALHPGRR